VNRGKEVSETRERFNQADIETTLNHLADDMLPGFSG